MKDPISYLTFVAVLGCGLVAGIFLAFSNFVMKALASVPPASGIASMQSINVMVLNRWFFAVFFGTAACCLMLVVASLLHWQRPGAAYLLALNDSLAAVDLTSADAAPTWSNYLKTWTVWNHVRTVAALAAATLFTVQLCRSSSSRDLARPKASSPTQFAALPFKPEDWPRQFEEQLNAGDLDGIMALYEPEARFVALTGETLVGRGAVRKVLSGLVEAKTQFHSRVVRAMVVGDRPAIHRF
jgi:uncharacterized membrane protein